MDFSNSESEGGTFGSSNSTSVVSSYEADLVTCQVILEEATLESSKIIKPDAAGWRGSSYIKISKGRIQGILSKFLGRRSSNRRKSNSECISSDISRDISRGSPREEQELLPDEHKQCSNRFSTACIRVLVRAVPKKLRKRKLDEYRRKVTVNGVPIKDVDVRKAEELAGPIHPGKFWYDIQAGFWGVEPGPCLGIIPPCIPELNVPMSRLCSRGNTGILVNGRELHRKDLERLSFRGLPTTPGRTYCISIDGRVIDDSSRRHVKNLGMLAPSLERSRRGEGIYTPAHCYLNSSSQSSHIQDRSCEFSEDNHGQC